VEHALTAIMRAGKCEEADRCEAAGAAMQGPPCARCVAAAFALRRSQRKAAERPVAADRTVQAPEEGSPGTEVATRDEKIEREAGERLARTIEDDPGRTQA